MSFAFILKQFPEKNPFRGLFCPERAPVFAVPEKRKVPPPSVKFPQSLRGNIGGKPERNGSAVQNFRKISGWKERMAPAIRPQAGFPFRKGEDLKKFEGLRAGNWFRPILFVK
jgi:hypothetical protein